MTNPKRTLESDYQRTLLARLALEFRDHRFFRRNTGLVRMDDGRRFKAGITGQCDLYVIGRNGWHGEVEIKRWSKLTEDQEHWRDWCISWGVPWLLLEASKEEAPSQTIARWMTEVGTWIYLEDPNATKLARPVAGR